jgi:hypothetical protein
MLSRWLAADARVERAVLAPRRDIFGNQARSATPSSRKEVIADAAGLL